MSQSIDSSGRPPQRTPRTCDVVHYRRDPASTATETRAVIGEVALAIELRGGPVFTIMSSPGDERDLALGFLFAEGLIGSLDEVSEIDACVNGGRVSVTVDGPIPEGSRNLVVNSSCGLCGREGLEALIARLAPCTSTTTFPLDALFAIGARVRAAQRQFTLTGGSHAAALFGASGEPLVVREDLGRHSALDKAIGYALRRRLPLAELAIFISGRASAEMVIKAARAGSPLVVAVSAASSAAIEIAERLGICLAGFARGDELTVYSHPERIVQS